MAPTTGADEFESDRDLEGYLRGLPGDADLSGEALERVVEYLEARDFSVRPLATEATRLLLERLEAEVLATHPEGVVVWVDVRPPARAVQERLVEWGYRVAAVHESDHDDALRYRAEPETDPLAEFALLHEHGLPVEEAYEYWGGYCRDRYRVGDTRDDWNAMRRQFASRQAVYDAQQRARERLPQRVLEYLEVVRSSEAGQPTSVVRPGATDAESGE